MSSYADFNRVLDNLIINKKIFYKDGFYYPLFLENKVIGKRCQREIYSKEKIAIAQKTAKILSRIPFIKLIGISGSLAVKNSSPQDDIDLFIISMGETCWITRLMAVLILETLGVRRRPKDINCQNKICLNMLMDENSLEIETKDKNLYTAHEILQLMPLFSKNYIYEKFLKSNKWIKKILPHAYPKFRQKSSMTEEKTFMISFVLGKINSFLRYLQLFYMSSKKTNETTGYGLIKFHPKDVTSKIINRYNRLLRNYGENVLK